MKVLWTLPHPSSNLDAPDARTDGPDWVISYREPFTDEQVELRFMHVIYFAYTDGDEATADQVEAYDQVIEIDDSPLASAVSTRRSAGRADRHHYRFFWDEYGAFDIVAEAFVPPSIG
jgi:hypothetical protein